jgi:CheY-like chemotaxis protein
MSHVAMWRSDSHFKLKEAWLVMNPPRVLLAEDDSELRALLASALRGDGYDVVEAEDGAELFGEIATGMLRPGRPLAPDIVISDIRMPGKSGLEVVAGMRQDDWATPVILITGFGDPQTRAEAARLGVAAIFDKPFDVDDLRTAVLNLVKMS